MAVIASILVLFTRIHLIPWQTTPVLAIAVPIVVLILPEVVTCIVWMIGVKVQLSVSPFERTFEIYISLDNAFDEEECTLDS